MVMSFLSSVMCLQKEGGVAGTSGPPPLPPPPKVTALRLATLLTVERRLQAQPRNDPVKLVFGLHNDTVQVV